MKWLTLFLVLFSISGVAEELAPLNEVPALYHGRYRPLKAALLQEGSPREWDAIAAPPFLLIPSRYKGEWLSLDALERSEGNPTPYPEDVFLRIKQSYLEKDPQALALALKEGYRSLEGRVFLKVAGKHLAYPTSLQLKTESLLTSFPFLLFLIGGYALAALMLIFSKWGRSILLCVFLFHTLLLALRIFVLKRPPVSNMAETLLYVPWITALMSLALGWISKKKVVFISGALGAGLILFLFWLSRLDEGLENLQPVLDSNYWLGTHVLMVVGSYGLFLLTSILSHIYLIGTLWAGWKKSSLPRLILQTLYIGTGMLVIGTLLGGVWAAESWGRFWDWDPKESWAFISSCAYLIIIHAYLFRLIREFGLAMGGALGFFAISFTWYGVNYILGTGLHSYGFGSGGEGFYYLFLAADLALLGALALTKRRQLS